LFYVLKQSFKKHPLSYDFKTHDMHKTRKSHKKITLQIMKGDSLKSHVAVWSN